MMVQRLVILLLVLMVVFVGCDEDEPVEDLKDTDAKSIIWEKDGAKMVLIPENFEQAKDTYDEFGDLVPGKLVSDSFYMDTTEVTVGQFKKFLKSSGYKPTDPIPWAELYEYSPTDDHPMIYVSWFDATAYCEWADKRLPTEKEWEFAARGGLVGKDFPWGDDESIAREYVNSAGIVKWGKDKWENCAPVGSFHPNGYGLFDMLGNVWEWCQDWWDSDKTRRILRGGSWIHNTDYLRVANRINYDPALTYYRHGFRCVSGFPVAQQ